MDIQELLDELVKINRSKPEKELLARLKPIQDQIIEYLQSVDSSSKEYEQIKNELDLSRARYKDFQFKIDQSGHGRYHKVMKVSR